MSNLSLPKGTITIHPQGEKYSPTNAFSYGEAFHTEDPRIGTGTTAGTLLAVSAAYQLVLTKEVEKTQFDLTLKHVSNSQELAKIDPDTGLQENVGPSVNQVLTASVQRTFSQGTIYISFARADARLTDSGEPVPEAPRLIWDAVGTLNRLPLHLRAKGEFEYVGAKPLGGGGFVGEATPEVRGALLRSFHGDRITLSTEFLIASGYTGQTIEVLPLPANFPELPPARIPTERIVGVPLKSYVR